MGLTFPNMVDGVVAGNYDRLWTDQTEASVLVFSWEWLVLTYFLEHVQHECFIFFDIINEDYFLIDVAVPIFCLIFLI